MRVFKDTPFEFGMMPWEHEPPNTIVLIFVKATFDLVPGGVCTIAGKQQTISGEVAYDDVEIPSARCESDFALYKAQGEYLVRGSAYAPGGRPAPLVPVSVKIGPLEKSLVVYGDRRWVLGALGAKPSDPEPFVSMPLRWERAFGGPSNPKNPSGRGMGPMAVDGGTIDPLPNLEDPNREIVGKSDAPDPVCFAPIATMWRERVSNMGTFDEEWLNARWPYLPRDFNFRFYQSAPADQRLPEGHWRGDEPMWLRGLHPEVPVVETRLPGLRARCFVEWAKPPAAVDPSASLAPMPVDRQPPRVEADGAPIPVPTIAQVDLTLDTITVDADALQAVCVWRGMLLNVSDSRMSNIERLFFMHESIEEEHPLPYYAAWAHRLVREEAGEDAELEPEEPPSEDPDTDPPPPPEEELPPDKRGDQVAANAMLEMYGAMEQLIDLDRYLEKPTATDVRKAFEDAGLEPPEDLHEIDDEPLVIPPEDELPRSALRLAAIIRRKLGRPFAGYDWTGAPFRRLNLSGADLSNTVLRDAELTEANLTGANLAGANLYGAQATRAVLYTANLEGTEISHANLEGADLRGANLKSAHGAEVRLVNAGMHGAQCEMVELLTCDLTGAHFDGANLDRADLSWSRMDGACFVNCSIVDASIRGTSARGATFERCRATDLRASEGVDLTDARMILMDAAKAQFQNAVGVRANFAGSNLEGADFSEATLLESNFVKANLKGACFGWADLRLALLMAANAFEADFDQANLEQADLRAAHFFSANLYRTRMGGTKLDGTILTRTYLDRS